MDRGFRTQQDKTPFDKLAQTFARTRLGGWLFVNVFPVIDRRLIPLTGGRLTVAVGQPVLLLHTRGARSGQPRSTPLLYLPERSQAPAHLGDSPRHERALSVRDSMYTYSDRAAAC